MSTYRERREAKADRLREWADKRDEKSTADYERAHDMASVIPFGQPILVGHHSEGRDRRYRARIASGMDRSIEHARKAENMRGRADGIERGLATSIYSDDPDAIDALRARIERLEAERDQIKTENAEYRKAHRAELKELTAYGRDQAMPHAGYELTNLTGNIKRNKDRLIVLERRQKRTETADAAGGTLVEEHPNGYATVTFAEKPERETITALKAAGFRWSGGSWFGSTASLPEGIR